MGVLGLAPFLQKHCPQVIKILPERLKHLQGKTIVIDGTLITQRLHFAPAPHPHRHILGWYRLITELKESDVRAMCVFDGKERNLAKAMEVARRKQARRISAVRGRLESERLQRLNRLSHILHAYQTLQPEDREQANETLRRLMAQATKLPPMTTVPAHEVPIIDLEPETSDPEDFVSEEDWMQLPSDFQSGSNANAKQPSDVPHKGNYLRSRRRRDKGETSTLVNNVASSSHAQDAQASYNSDLHNIDPGPPVYVTGELYIDWDGYSRSQSPPPNLAPVAVFNSLADLYQNYLSTLPSSQAPSLPLPETSEAYSTPESYLHDEDQPSSPEILESRTQYHLTIEEGRIWHDLAESVSTPERDPSEALAALADRSLYISESYERRSKPPSYETYEESKMLLEAMGVPCIESSGPFEAEALASSLVLNGYADFVASEDTDVLIYEAPLIRNITNRKQPLITISGSSVRTALHLTRSSYIDFALLLGTDFSQRIPNVGPSRALKFIRKHGTIERVVAEERTRTPPRGPETRYFEQIGLAREVFATLPPVPEDVAVLEGKEEDWDAVSRIMSQFGLSRAVDDKHWDSGASLAGNYFDDNPAVDPALKSKPQRN
ncbi:PIN domain-like protein [Rickenella mellea]|uniref:PIN domain-like protein n=1 Tax=Rickenella mellea TaxID=50990 RepID=A0A4Y7Q6V7_9AGAM|nr:PIN domain-like protein [Rickenella mellea]